MGYSTSKHEIESKEWTAALNAKLSTNPFRPGSHGTLAVDIVCSAGSGTVKLQHQVGETWTDLKSTAVAVGVSSIKVNKEDAADLTLLPIREKCRLLVTGTLTIDKVFVTGYQ